MGEQMKLYSRSKDEIEKLQYRNYLKDVNVSGEYLDKSFEETEYRVNDIPSLLLKGF